MCFREVEDSAHIFFRCPAYRTQRDALANQVCTLATPGARKAMQGVMRGERDKSGGRGMRDELVYERWGVCVGHGVLGGGDGGESICFR